MRFVLPALLLLCELSLCADLCIKEIENPYPEPYLSHLLRQRLERAALASGNKLGCGEGSEDVRARVETFRETPIAFTPDQRVSSYNLELKVSVSIGEKTRAFSSSVSYSQQSGGVGDLPKRRASEEAMNIIYLEILEFFKRR